MGQCRGGNFYIHIYNIYGRGSAILSAQEGKSGSIYNLVVVRAAQTCAHFMKIVTVYTLNSHLFFTFKRHLLQMETYNVYEYIDLEYGPLVELQHAL